MRGGKYPKSSVPQSPFRAAQTVNPDASAALLEIQNFPSEVSENAAVSVQVSSSSGNILGQDHLTPAGSNTDIEIMMSRLLEAHQLRSEEIHRQQLGRQQEELKRTIETTIAQHCQSLSSAIVQERTERTQAI